MSTEFKQYTPEQEAKIAMLRKEAETQKIKNLWDKTMEERHAEKFELKVGDPCFVTIDGVTISGYIMEIDSRDKWNKLYEIKTPNGRIVDIPARSVSRRFVKDYSNVVIPEALKSMSTPDLLALLRASRQYYEYDDYYKGSYTEDQIKAELSKRPHIPNKRETKMVNSRKKKR